MDRQDLPHDRTAEGISWQREMHDNGWRFPLLPPVQKIELGARNTELEMMAAEAAGYIATEEELVAA